MDAMLSPKPADKDKTAAKNPVDRYHRLGFKSLKKLVGPEGFEPSTDGL